MEINGINYSYDYSELIEELQSDIDEGLIKNSTIIGVLRDDKPIYSDIDYKPIIDYYYPHVFEKDSPAETLSKEEYTEDEWASIVKEYQKSYKQFENDKPKLQNATVLAVLTEMKNWNFINY